MKHNTLVRFVGCVEPTAATVRPPFTVTRWAFKVKAATLIFFFLNQPLSLTYHFPIVLRALNNKGQTSATAGSSFKINVQALLSC